MTSSKLAPTPDSSGCSAQLWRRSISYPGTPGAVRPADAGFTFRHCGHRQRLQLAWSR